MKEHQQPITGLGAGEIAPHVFLCGDPERVERISEHWDERTEVCRVREYVVHTGRKDGVPLTTASTGIGGPSTAIMVEELVKLGARTLIRVGNSGAMSDQVQLGDYVVTAAAVRDEGTSKSYVTTEYPAAAHYEVTAALMEAGATRGYTCHAGVTWSIDGFYARNKVLAEGGQFTSMCSNGFHQSFMDDKLRDMQAAGVLNVEMESSTLLTLASLYGLRAGCICTMSDRAPWPGPGQDMITLNKNIEGAIEIALVAMMHLAESG